VVAAPGRKASLPIFRVLVPIPGNDLTTTAALLILRFVKNFKIGKETAVVEGTA
jgi:uncharacterized protein YggT (Ycf19 family)